MAESNIKKAEILDLVTGLGKPVTPKEVGDAKKISWNTAQAYLVELAREGLLQHQRVGGQNIFSLPAKSNGKLSLKELENHLWKAADICVLLLGTDCSGNPNAPSDQDHPCEGR